MLLKGLNRALVHLQKAGCRRLYLNGSFVTAKDDPADFDACWDAEGVDLPLLAQIAPVFFDLRPGRQAQKEAFFGELFPAQTTASAVGSTFLEYFQRDKLSGAPKGILSIDLEG